MTRDWMLTKQEIVQKSQSDRDVELILSMHRIKVLGAMMRGDHIPAPVLADYPDLQTKAFEARKKLEENRRVFGLEAPLFPQQEIA